MRDVLCSNRNTFDHISRERTTFFCRFYISIGRGLGNDIAIAQQEKKKKKNYVCEPHRAI